MARNEQLQGRIAETAGRTDAAGQETAAVAGQLADAKRQLAQTPGCAGVAVQAELDKTVKADRATIDARVGDIARLTALRDQLQHQVDDAADARHRRRPGAPSRWRRSGTQALASQAAKLQSDAGPARCKADRATLDDTGCLKSPS